MSKEGHVLIFKKTDKVAYGGKMDKRTELRILRLLNTHKKLAARYVHFPEGDKRDALGVKLLELEQSLKNLKEHGREKLAGTGKGISVEVPVRDFSIVGKE